MVLEEYEHAKARGANILAEVMGFGMTADAGDMVHPKVEGAAGAMQIALDDAGLKPEQIDYINAHGTATKTNDITETNAIKSVFGDAAYDVSISSTKSMHGHMLGGGSLVEAAAVLWPCKTILCHRPLIWMNQTLIAILITPPMRAASVRSPTP